MRECVRGTRAYGDVCEARGRTGMCAGVSYTMHKDVLTKQSNRWTHEAGG